MVDNRFDGFPADGRFPSPGTDTRFPSPDTDTRFPSPGEDTRFSGDGPGPGPDPTPPDLSVGDWYGVQSPRDDLVTQNGDLWRLERQDGQSEAVMTKLVEGIIDTRDYYVSMDIVEGNASGNFYRLYFGSAEGAFDELQVIGLTGETAPLNINGVASDLDAIPYYMSLRIGSSGAETYGIVDDATSYVTPLENVNLLGALGGLDDRDAWDSWNGNFSSGKLIMTTGVSNTAVLFHSSDVPWIKPNTSYRIRMGVDTLSGGEVNARIGIGEARVDAVAMSVAGVYDETITTLSDTGVIAAEFSVRRNPNTTTGSISWVLIEELPDLSENNVLLDAHFETDTGAWYNSGTFDWVIDTANSVATTDKTANGNSRLRQSLTGIMEDFDTFDVQVKVDRAENFGNANPNVISCGFNFGAAADCPVGVTSWSGAANNNPVYFGLNTSGAGVGTVDYAYVVITTPPGSQVFYEGPFTAADGATQFWMGGRQLDGQVIAQTLHVSLDEENYTHASEAEAALGATLANLLVTAQARLENA